MTFRELVRRYVRPFWKDLAAMVVLTLAANVLALVNPAIIAAALAVFDVTPGGSAPGRGSGLDLNSLGERVLAALSLPVADRPGLVIALLTAAYVVQTCGMAGLNYAARLTTLKIRTNATSRIRMDLFRHLYSQPLSFFHREKSGELLSRLTHDAQSVGHGVGPLVRGLLHHNIQLIGYGAYLVRTDAWLTIIVLVIIGLHFGFSQLLGRRMRHVSRQVADHQAHFSVAVQESLTSVRVSKSFGAEEHELRRLQRSVSDVAEASMAEGGVYRLEEPVRSVLDSLATFAIFFFAAAQLRAGRLTIEGLVLYVYVGRLLITPVNLSATNYLWLQSLLAGFDRINQLLSIRSPLVDGPETRTVLERSIELKSVSFSYGTQRVLDDVSLEIRRGEVVALVGPSGAGKSTLTDLVLRLHDPDKGEILIDGMNLRCLAQAPYRRQFGVVSQEALLFHDTIASNIRYGRSGLGDEAIVRAAKIANAHDFIMRLPLGYETIVGDRGVRLSGGERQRVAIARAVVHDPQILILDEATSALDSESERQVQLAIERVTRNVTAIIVAHRLSTVRHAHRIVVLDRGRIIDCGRHDELLNRCALYAHLCELQFGPAQSELLA